MSHSDLMTALQKLLPWSLCMDLGTPNLLTSLTKVFANVSDEVSLNGNASTHFVKRSVTTRMYLFPLRVTGSGPIMSHAIFTPQLARQLGCPKIVLDHVRVYIYIFIYVLDHVRVYIYIYIYNICAHHNA